jgi:rhodanese-related sulfurtransferase
VHRRGSSAKTDCPETLRTWLEEKRPVTVIDVQSDEGREQWSIPGSVHINVYEALRACKRRALAEAERPREQPIVTVCNLGKMSERAADELSRRGLDVLSSERRQAWLESESAFILSRIPQTPPNFERIVELAEFGELPPEDPTELEAGANRCAVG